MAFMKTWEEYRKHARELEYVVDAKLISLNKLGQSIGTESSRPDINSKSENSSLLLPSSANIDSLCKEIEELLGKLTEVNDRMSMFVNSNLATMPSNSALLHTLQRHRDILQDYKTEFTKTKQNLMSRREREQLLGSVNKDVESYKMGGLNNRSKNELYLKEHDHIKSSDRLVDEQISVAINMKENLQNQHYNLRDMSRKINTITKKYPIINNLMQKIHLKKRRDSLVLGGVIALCLVLMFIYASR